MLFTVTEKITNQSDAATHFSAERTFLAWIRTGLSMMGFGFVVARFGLFLRQMEALGSNSSVQTHTVSMWTGVALVALGVIVNLVAAWQHWMITRRITRQEALKFSPITLGTVVAILLAIMGASLIGYLIFEVQKPPAKEGANSPKSTPISHLEQPDPAIDFASACRTEVAGAG